MAKKINITFTKSPTGAFNLSDNVGENVDMEEQKAREIIEAGFAMITPPSKTKTNPPKKETATAKQPNKETRKGK